MTGYHDGRLPLRLNELTPAQAGQALLANPRLLLPVGTMVVRSQRLPIGADTLIVDRVADAVSGLLQIVRAPVIPFGVHARSDPDAPGCASLTRKTLHRIINELIAAWETEAKVRDFVILTAHTADAHLEALSTIRSNHSVRLIDIFEPALPSTAGDTEPIEVPLIAYLAPSLTEPQPAAVVERGRQAYRIIVDAIARELSLLAE
jgi:creatinine amidohydrolase